MEVKDAQSHSFGQLIAYLIPGFIALCGLGRLSPTIHHWLQMPAGDSNSIGGLLFGTLAAFGCGLVINALRWHIVDPLHYLSGVPRKSWDYSLLPEQIAACRYLVVHQFRYYECYANTMVAIAVATAGVMATSHSTSAVEVGGFLLVQGLLWSASRRTLKNYHLRIAAFLNRPLEARTNPIPEPIRIDPPRPTRYKEVSESTIRRRILIPLLFRRPAAGRFGLDDHNH